MYLITHDMQQKSWLKRFIEDHDFFFCCQCQLLIHMVFKKTDATVYNMRHNEYFNFRQNTAYEPINLVFYPLVLFPFHCDNQHFLDLACKTCESTYHYAKPEIQVSDNLYRVNVFTVCPLCCVYIVFSLTPKLKGTWHTVMLLTLLWENTNNILSINNNKWKSLQNAWYLYD